MAGCACRSYPFQLWSLDPSGMHSPPESEIEYTQYIEGFSLQEVSSLETIPNSVIVLFFRENMSVQ